MSTFSRKGTVSKASSGPTHSNSYAMRGIPIRYKPPIFVPELLQLPADWTKPTLPSSYSFNYDFTLERKISEQAKLRAISIAAEASLQRKQVLALQHQNGLATSSELPPLQTSGPRLPFMSSTDILTPTPVPLPTPSSVAAGNTVACASVAGSSSNEESSSSTLIEETNPVAVNKDKSEAMFKSLGNWSLQEFEGDTMDPFETTSLQAINDIEELQSVLQPTSSKVITNSSPVVSQSALVSTSHSAIQSTPVVSSHATTDGLITLTYGANTPHLSSSNSSPEVSSSGNQNSLPTAGERRGSHTGIFPLEAVPSAKTHCNQQAVPSIAVLSNSFSGGHSALTNVNPFLTSDFAQKQLQFPPVSNVQQQVQQPIEPGVGTLVDLGGNGTGYTHHPKPPVPAPRTSPKLVNPSQELQSNAPVSSSSSQSHGMSPIPKPRKRTPSPSPVNTTPPREGVIHPTITSSEPSPPNTSTVVASRSVGSGSPKFLPGIPHSHINMGVAVLPPITPSVSTSSLQTSNVKEHPPAYKLHATPPTSHRNSPPPPYSYSSSNKQPHAPPPGPIVAPKTYVLPNPEASLTIEQRDQVKTISGMGFPPQRVGRAMLRFEDDQSKILDFLFLVGELEEANFNGDSAETALIACKDDLEKAKAYLQKLGMYKEIGFQEKAIHKAYTEAKGDWDQALDILTRDR